MTDTPANSPVRPRAHPGHRPSSLAQPRAPCTHHAPFYTRQPGQGRRPRCKRPRASSAAGAAARPRRRGAKALPQPSFCLLSCAFSLPARLRRCLLRPAACCAPRARRFWSGPAERATEHVARPRGALTPRARPASPPPGPLDPSPRSSLFVLAYFLAPGAPCVRPSRLFRLGRAARARLVPRGRKPQRCLPPLLLQTSADVQGGQVARMFFAPFALALSYPARCASAKAPRPRRGPRHMYVMFGQIGRAHV